MRRPGLLMGATALAVAGAVAVTVLLAGGDEPAPGGWSPPLPATSLRADDGDIAIAADGTALATWTEERRGRTAVMFAERAPHGRWSTPTPILPPQRWRVRWPRIAAGEDGGAAVTFGLLARQASVVLGSVRPPGGGWEAPQALTRVVRGPLDGDGPVLDPTGGVVVAWTAWGEGVLASVRPAGRRWSDPERVGPAPRPLAPAAQAALAPDGTAVVAAIGPGVVVRPPGAAWRALPPLPGDGLRASSPGATALAVDGSGRPTVVWTRPTGADVELVASRYADGAWSTPRVLDRAGADRPPAGVRVERSGAGVAIAWGRWSRACTRVAIRASLPDATGDPQAPRTLDAFATPDACTGSTGPASPPTEIRISGGARPVALWTRRVDRRRGTSHLAVSAVGADGSWGHPERVTSAPVSGWPLSAGRDGDHPMASWAEYDGTGAGGLRLLVSERRG